MEELQARLSALTLTPDKFIEAQPAAVQARVTELSKLQTQYEELHEAFLKEKAALEAKYAAAYAPLFTDRAAIVSGEKPVQAGTPNGVPDFWLTVLMRLDLTRELMNEKDIDALRYLTDLRAETLEPSVNEDGDVTGGFRLVFTFSDNPYFNNKELTKTYHLLEDDEAVLEKAEGCSIDWKPGKNVTVKIMKKKPKKGAPASAKPQTKAEPVESFFNFFSPPEMPDTEEDQEDEELEALHEEIEQDYETGATLRTKIIPHAVQWFTGEALDGDDDDFDVDEDEDDLGEDEDEDEDEDDDDPTPPRGGNRKAARRGGAAATGEQPQECKQQ